MKISYLLNSSIPSNLPSSLQVAKMCEGMQKNSHDVSLITPMPGQGNFLKFYNIKTDIKNIVCGISASGPTKQWDIENYIKLFQKINYKFRCKFFLFGGKNDEALIKKLMSSVPNCISLSKLDLEQIIPIISACRFYIGNDTGPLHISANLGLKCLSIFCDSPPSAYGTWNPNIKIIVPSEETIETTVHNTQGKDKISFDEVLKKFIDLIN